MIIRTGNYYYGGITKGAEKADKFKRGKEDAPKFEIRPELYLGPDKKMMQNFLAEAFTVAGVTHYELQEKLKQLAKDIADGNTEEQKAKGVEHVDAKKLWKDLSEDLIAQYSYGFAPPRGHLLTNYQTALTSAYHGTLWKKIETAGIYIALQYKTRMDERVREKHKTLQDRVFYRADAIWDKIYPPNGWNCRCYTIPLTAAQLKSMGLTPESSDGALKKITEEAGVDTDFARNSGMTESIWGKWLESGLKEINYEKVREQMKNFAGKTMRDKLNKYAREEFDEVWGEVIPGKKRESVIRRIRYGGDKITVKISDTRQNKVYDAEAKVIDADNFRRGVLIKI